MVEAACLLLPMFFEIPVRNYALLDTMDEAVARDQNTLAEMLAPRIRAAWAAEGATTEQRDALRRMEENWYNLQQQIAHLDVQRSRFTCLPPIDRPTAGARPECIKRAVAERRVLDNRATLFHDESFMRFIASQRAPL